MDVFGGMRLKQKVIAAKRKSRAIKRTSKSRSQSKALPKVPVVALPPDYTDPVTLSPPKNRMVYQVTNRTTGRKNYYNKRTLLGLIGRQLTNYQLLLADPKVALFANPMTRGGVYPRNIQRVTRG
jgi:hypothetical protein